MISSRARATAVACAIGCAIVPRTVCAHTRDTSRVWEQGSWLSMGGVPADAQILDHPLSIALARDAVYVFDAASANVIALGLDGHLLWRYSPADSLRFSADRVVTLAAARDGGVWIADPNSGRCTILSPLGKVERVVAFRNGKHFAPRSDGSFWEAPFLDVAPVLFDANGRRERTLRLPRSVVVPPHAVGDALLAVTADTLVVAYSMAGYFLIAAPHGGVRAVRAIEPRPFARFEESDVSVGGRVVHSFKTGTGAPPATLGLAVDSGVIYALYWNARDGADDRGRTLDMYRASSGTYLGSRRLPMSATDLAVRGDVVYALTDDGDLRIWRWMPAARSPAK